MTSPQTDAGTVLVTGGSGFLGSWCLVELLRQGYRVRTTVRDRSREPEVRAMLASETDAGDSLSVFSADLTSDKGWEEAIAGCDYVLHVASPFPPQQPKDADELIVPAREGTLRVLRTALDAGVKRVVVTSSTASVVNSRERAAGMPFTEADWTDPTNTELSPYVRSKTIAEGSAWTLVHERGDPGRLAVVCPSAILGPVLSDDRSYSLQVIERLLNGMPGLPRLGFSFVDVRDVADLQVRAMTQPAGAGQRFLATGPFLWMADVAEILRERLGPRAAKVPKRKVPDFVVKTMARFDPSLRTVVRDLGRQRIISNDKAKTELGWQPRPIEQTIVDCAESLLRVGAVTAEAA
jgi:dihydroflavonol-4-reductase